MLDLKEVERIKQRLREDLSTHRYEHTLGVAYTAAALAMCHGESYENALLAGLLHDCAKGYSTEKLKKYLLRAGVSIEKEDDTCPQIFHAIYGAIMAKEVYGIADAAILSAIRWHTTGCKGMSTLDKIVFIADAIEPNRGEQTYLSKARTLAFSDLNWTMDVLLRETIAYLEKKEMHIHIKTRECMAWIEQERRG